MLYRLCYCADGFGSNVFCWKCLLLYSSRAASFPCTALVWLWRRGSAGLKRESGSAPSCSLFWRSVRKICVRSCLNIWWNSLIEPSGFWAFLCWDVFDYRFSLRTHYWSVHIFYFFLSKSRYMACFWEFIHFF